MTPPSSIPENIVLESPHAKFEIDSSFALVFALNGGFATHPSELEGLFAYIDLHFHMTTCQSLVPANKIRFFWLNETETILSFISFPSKASSARVNK